MFCERLSVDPIVGASVESQEGRLCGRDLNNRGCSLETAFGISVGSMDGVVVASDEILADRFADGLLEGCKVGSTVGLPVTHPVGSSLACLVKRSRASTVRASII